MIIDKLTALIRGHTSIRLIGEPREGSYTYVTSPELPGFSFLLEPGEDKDLKTILDALFEPLVAYLTADLMAKNASRAIPYFLDRKNWKRGKSPSLKEEKQSSSKKIIRKS